MIKDLILFTNVSNAFDLIYRPTPLSPAGGAGFYLQFLSSSPSANIHSAQEL